MGGAAEVFAESPLVQRSGKLFLPALMAVCAVFLYKRDNNIVSGGSEVLFGNMFAPNSNSTGAFKRPDNLYEAQFGEFNTAEARASIDELTKHVFADFPHVLGTSTSLHVYIDKLSPQVQKIIDSSIRKSPEIYSSICNQFVVCNPKPLADSDELYLSHFNYDAGGDQGLFDKHYDGNLRFLQDATVVRALVYLVSENDWVVVFRDSEKRKNFRSYEYGILDFNREYHWVEGSKANATDPPRVLLKINYLVCPNCSQAYEMFVTLSYKAVFFTVKATMEWAKSPKTVLQKSCGILFNNGFRLLNNIHPTLPFASVYAMYCIISRVVGARRFLYVFAVMVASHAVLGV